MKSYIDCIPCFVRQVLEVAKMATDDEVLRERILRESLEILAELDFTNEPPLIARNILGIAKGISGNTDPYRQEKAFYNKLAMDMYPRLKRKVKESDRPLETAVRLAIAGNIIDLGVGMIKPETVYDTVEEVLECPFAIDDFGEFENELSCARKILYLGDNAGEIVFDRVLIEELKDSHKIIYAVRGVPVINDVTMEDAREVGLDKIVEIISNGSDVSGTVLGLCSEDLKNEFDRADIIISKGQGNYETLSGVPKKIFFLLRAKCSVIARDLGCDLNGIVIRRSQSMEGAQKESISPEVAVGENVGKTEKN